MTEVLNMQNIFKSFYMGEEELEVLHDVNLTVNSGEFLSILGPSGSGKSTMMNIIGCLDVPTSGKYLLSGNEGDWTKKNLNLDIDLEKISYLGDEHLLQQVWLNLIQNAIKFSNQNGVIRVALHKSDGIIRVDIADNGKGIPDKDKQRIFDRFYKADKSRSKDGNGLGLARFSFLPACLSLMALQ